MIARPKMSQNEWKPTEIRASKVGNFSPFSCPGVRLGFANKFLTIRSLSIVALFAAAKFHETCDRGLIRICVELGNGLLDYRELRRLEITLLSEVLGWDIQSASRERGRLERRDSGQWSCCSASTDD